jgi:hypothetical protein
LRTHTGDPYLTRAGVPVLRTLGMTIAMPSEIEVVADPHPI